MVLISIAEILQEAFRDYDVVARFGGEEYAVLLPETTPEQALQRIDNVREKIEAADFEVSTSITPIKATMSFGVAGRGQDEQSANDIIHNADVALYRAKLSGRNCTRVYSGEELDDLFAGVQIEAAKPTDVALRARLDASQFTFQPNPLRERPQVKPQAAETTPVSKPDPRPAWMVSAYIAGLAMFASTIAVFLLQRSSAPDWFGLSLFALIVILMEGLAIDIYVNDTSISIAAAPLIAGVLLFGPAGAVTISLLLAGTAMLKHRSRWDRFLFNAGNHLISSFLPLGLLLLSGTSITGHPTVVQLSFVIVSAELVYVISTLLLAGVVSLSTGHPFRLLWKERFQWLWPYYIAIGVGAYALLFSYMTSGLVGVLVILVPLFMLRFSQVQYVHHTESLVNRLRSQNVQLEKQTVEISGLNEELLLALANVIDLRDPYVLGHSQQVARYAVLIAQELGVDPERTALVRKAALLHDIGKLGVAEAILTKPDRLTDEEYEVIKTHPTLGAEIVEACKSLQQLIPMIRHHHERYDGKGYPDGLKGQQIPLEARIVGFADALEAMASDRPYRKALDFQTIEREMRENSGTQFDPTVVEAFFKIVGREGQSVIVNSAFALEETIKLGYAQSTTARLEAADPFYKIKNTS